MAWPFQRRIWTTCTHRFGFCELFRGAFTFCFSRFVLSLFSNPFCRRRRPLALPASSLFSAAVRSQIYSSESARHVSSDALSPSSNTLHPVLAPESIDSNAHAGYSTRSICTSYIFSFVSNCAGLPLLVTRSSAFLLSINATTLLRRGVSLFLYPHPFPSDANSPVSVHVHTHDRLREPIRRFEKHPDRCFSPVTDDARSHTAR